MHAIDKCVSTILSVQDVQLNIEVFSICHVPDVNPKNNVHAKELYRILDCLLLRAAHLSIFRSDLFR